MRPPVSTWDLITTGPAMSAAITRASSAVLANPCLVTGIPALATTARDSYSKKRIGGGGGYKKAGAERRSPRARRPELPCRREDAGRETGSLGLRQVILRRGLDLA